MESGWCPDDVWAAVWTASSSSSGDAGFSSPSPADETPVPLYSWPDKQVFVWEVAIYLTGFWLPTSLNPWLSNAVYFRKFVFCMISLSVESTTLRWCIVQHLARLLRVCTFVANLIPSEQTLVHFIQTYSIDLGFSFILIYHNSRDQLLDGQAFFICREPLRKMFTKKLGVLL